MILLDAKATIALHYVFSILNPMYIPYALVYFVDRIYIGCSLTSACASLSFINYMTEEIIVMIISVVLHIPVWSLCLRIVDIKKNGGKVNDIWRRKVESEEIVPAEEYIGEFEDDDVKVEREKVLNMSSTSNMDLQPVVIVKVSRLKCFNYQLRSLFSTRTSAKSSNKTILHAYQLVVHKPSRQRRLE